MLKILKYQFLNMFGTPNTFTFIWWKNWKMHHGHRGANHPIKNHANGKVEITVQNHGFLFKKKVVKEYGNNSLIAFDGTIAGIKITKKALFFCAISSRVFQVHKTADIYLKNLKNL